MFKKVMSFILLGILVLSLGVIVYADEKQASPDVHIEGETDCPYGTHRMISSGTATVKDPSGKTILTGGYYVCSYCGDIFVCTGYPHFGGPIANHFYGSEIKFVGSIGSTREYQTYTRTTPHYTNSSTLPGFNFIAQSIMEQ